MGKSIQGRGPKTNAKIKQAWSNVKTFAREKALPALKEAGREFNEFAKEHKLGQAAINTLGGVAAAFNPAFAAPIGIATRVASGIAAKKGYGRGRGRGRAYGGALKLVKGSAAAKAHMAKLRSMRGRGYKTPGSSRGGAIRSLRKIRSLFSKKAKSSKARKDIDRQARASSAQMEKLAKRLEAKSLAPDFGYDDAGGDAGAFDEEQEEEIKRPPKKIRFRAMDEQLDYQPSRKEYLNPRKRSRREEDNMGPRYDTPKQKEGTFRQVWSGKAERTPSGLRIGPQTIDADGVIRRGDLAKNSRGRIVSWKRHVHGLKWFEKISDLEKTPYRNLE